MSAPKPLTINYTSRALSKAIAKLYLNEDQADIHFVFKSADGTCERVPAHKFLLMSVSSVFRAMFNESWIEKTEVEIVDASAAAFREFLQFFYQTDIKLTMENAGEVMNLRNKYDVNDCFDICANFMQNNLTVNDVCAVYEVSIRLEHQKLIKFCEIFISLNSIDTFSSEGFLKVDRSLVKRILQMHSLNCAEAEVFKALLHWIKGTYEMIDFTNENMQGQFSDLLREIRFGQMKVQEFALLDPRTLFTCDELSEIIQMIASSEYQPNIFSNNRNKRGRTADMKNNGEIVCRRLFSVKVSGVPYFIKDEETTTFSVDKHLWLFGFVTSPLCIYRNKGYKRLDPVPCDIIIYELNGLSLSDEKKILHEEQLIMDNIKTQIQLSESILIRPGFLYEIRMKFTPSEKCCTGGLLMSHVKIEPDVTVEFYNDPNVEGDAAKRGVIIELNFGNI